MDEKRRNIPTQLGKAAFVAVVILMVFYIVHLNDKLNKLDAVVYKAEAGAVRTDRFAAYEPECLIKETRREERGVLHTVLEVCEEWCQVRKLNIDGQRLNASCYVNADQVRCFDTETECRADCVGGYATRAIDVTAEILNYTLYDEVEYCTKTILVDAEERRLDD